MNSIKHPLALLTCACAASLSSAGPVTSGPSVEVKFDSWIFTGSGYDNVLITFPNQNPASGSTTEHVSAGRFQGTASKVIGVDESIFVDGLNDLFMYCYDVYDNINHGQTVKYAININSDLDSTRDFLGAVNAVMNQGKSEAQYDKYAWLHPVNGYQGAAIQLGIWESKYETNPNWDLGAGSFKASWLETPTANYWNTFKTAIPHSSSIDGKYIMTLDATGAQDMITGDPPVTLPEPGTLVLFGVAMAGLAFAQRKKTA